MLCIMYEGSPYGHLSMHGEPLTIDDLTRLVSCPKDEVEKLLQELEKKEIFSRNSAGCIYNRRMLRDKEISAIRTEVGKKGGNPNYLRGTVPKELRNPPYKLTGSKAKTERIFHKNNGLCHWCSTPLDRQNAGPNFFQVDHVIPLRDGGTNDEDNLVPACAACNHKRAQGILVGGSDNQNADTDTNTKSKSKKLEEDIPKATPSAPASPVPVEMPNVRDQLWTDGLPIIQALTGRSEKSCRTFLGKLLKEARDDCARTLQALREAASLRPADPPAWLKAAVTPPRGGLSREMDAKAQALARLGGLDVGKKTHDDVTGPMINEAGETIHEHA
jgi:hypothetical protein